MPSLRPGGKEVLSLSWMKGPASQAPDPGLPEVTRCWEYGLGVLLTALDTHGRGWDNRALSRKRAPL